MPLFKRRNRSQPLVAFEDTNGVSPRHPPTSGWDQFLDKENGGLTDNENKLVIDENEEWTSFESSLFPKKSTAPSNADGNIMISPQNSIKSGATGGGHQSLKEEGQQDADEEDADSAAEMRLLQKVMAENGENESPAKEDEPSAPYKETVAIEDILNPAKSNSELGDDWKEEKKETTEKEDDDISFPDRREEEEEGNPIECFMKKELSRFKDTPKKSEGEVFINLKVASPAQDDVSCEMTYSPSIVGSAVGLSQHNVAKDLNAISEDGIYQDAQNAPSTTNRHSLPPSYALFDNTTEILSDVNTPSCVTGYMSPKEPRVSLASSLDSSEHYPTLGPFALTEESIDTPEGLKETYFASGSSPKSEAHSYTIHPVGSTEAEIDTLNRFLAIVGPNFDGKNLSCDEREEVYKKAARAGLTEAVVNELLNRSAGNSPKYDDDEVSAFSELSNDSRPPGPELLKKTISTDHSNATNYTKDTENISYFNLPRMSPQATPSNYNCTNTFKEYFWSESKRTGESLLENIAAVMSNENKSFDVEV